MLTEGPSLGPGAAQAPLSPSRKPGPGPGWDRHAGSHHGQKTCRAGRAARQPSRACRRAPRPPPRGHAWPGVLPSQCGVCWPARCHHLRGPWRGSSGHPDYQPGSCGGLRVKAPDCTACVRRCHSGPVTEASGSAPSASRPATATWMRHGLRAGASQPMGSAARSRPSRAPLGQGAGRRDPRHDAVLRNSPAPSRGTAGCAGGAGPRPAPEPRPPPSVHSCALAGPGAAQASGGQTRGDSTGA